MSYNNNSLLETTCNDEQLMQDIREAIELGLHMNLDNDLEVEIMWSGKMHQIMIDKWNLQITRVNEIIASRPVGQAMPAIGCYQFLPSSTSPCLAVKATHDTRYIRYIYIIISDNFSIARKGFSLKPNYKKVCGSTQLLVLVILPWYPLPQNSGIS